MLNVNLVPLSSIFLLRSSMKAMFYYLYTIKQMCIWSKLGNKVIKIDNMLLHIGYCYNKSLKKKMNAAPVNAYFSKNSKNTNKYNNSINK